MLLLRLGWRFTAATVRAGESPTVTENQHAQSRKRAVIVFVCDPPVVASYVSIDVNNFNPSVRETLLQLAEVTIEEATTKQCK